MTHPSQTTPDDLLDSFKGRNMKSIILVTLIVHAIIIGGTSIPYILKSFSGKSDSKLSEEERTEIAAREATSALRDIATKHGIKPQDLSSRIAGAAGPAAPSTSTTTPKDSPKDSPKTPPAETTTPAVNTPTSAVTEPEKPQSVIEQNIEKKQEGPKVPAIPVEEAEDEDLFK
jgi:hypothetical protein